MPEKGVNPYAVKRCSDNLDSLGFRRLNLKCGTELAMLTLSNAAKVESVIGIIPADVPPGESQANGEVENAF